MTLRDDFVKDLNRQRWVRAGLVVLSIGLMSSTSATTAPVVSSHRYGVAGVEMRASSVEGIFVGGAAEAQFGGLLWKAVVRHTPLTRTIERPALITGGRVTLQVFSGKALSTESHSFSGGTIAYAAGRSTGSACGEQVFPREPTSQSSTESRGLWTYKDRLRSPPDLANGAAAATTGRPFHWWL
jgi:hypothetical protein